MDRRKPWTDFWLAWVKLIQSPSEKIPTSQHGCDKCRNQAPCIDGEVEDWEVPSPFLCLKKKRPNHQCNMPSSSTPYLTFRLSERYIHRDRFRHCLWECVCEYHIRYFNTYLADPRQTFPYLSNPSTSIFNIFLPLYLGKNDHLVHYAYVLCPIHIYPNISFFALNVCFFL